jgi:chromosome segregation ATPase
MRPAASKAPKKTITQENLELLQQLEKIQESIEKQETLCSSLEKENQKLKMLQNFSSVFNKTQSSKDSQLVTSITEELTKIKSFLSSEVQEIIKLRKEKHDLTNKLSLVDQELSTLRPSQPESTRKIARERSYNEISFKFP